MDSAIAKITDVDTRVGIVGVGLVGSAMVDSFIEFGYELGSTLFAYDKYKDGGIGSMEDVMKADLLFMALPTLYSDQIRKFDLTSIRDTLEILKNKKYDGVIIIKSTVEPTTTEMLSQIYDTPLIHNPEFLTARTSVNDFRNQKQIVIGNTKNCPQKNIDITETFFRKYFSNASIFCCTSTESECIKLFANCFYATKVQYFTEIYLLCEKLGVSYDTVKNAMIRNEWINPMHTTVPGPDGMISYGGMCFPKDTMALLNFMHICGTPNQVLRAVTCERDMMRGNT